MTMTQNPEQAEHFRTIPDTDWFYRDRGWLDGFYWDREDKGQITRGQSRWTAVLGHIYAQY